MWTAKRPATIHHLEGFSLYEIKTLLTLSVLEKTGIVRGATFANKAEKNGRTSVIRQVLANMRFVVRQGRAKLHGLSRSRSYFQTNMSAGRHASCD